jgi:hypothetical protein
MKPSFLNLFMKKFTRECVVPIILASASCEINGHSMGVVWLSVARHAQLGTEHKTMSWPE